MDTTQAAQSRAAAGIYRGGMEFGQESRIKTPCSGLPRRPSLHSLMISEKSSKNFIFIFPWKSNLW